MNNPKHTPGPWRLNEFHVNREGLTVCELVTSDNSKRIARIDGHVLDSCKASNEANADARLISASPDLLSVARELEFLIKKYDVGAIPMRLRQDLKNAITKATGGSNE